MANTTPPTSLHALASKLATMDQPEGENIDVVEAQAVLSSLGKLLRSCTPAEALAIISAIVGKAGKREKTTQTEPTPS